MIRLPYTGTYSLELVTAQNGASVVVNYSDESATGYSGSTQATSITSATTTTICATPAAATVRDLDNINIKNTYAGSHTMTVQIDANGTNYPLIAVALLENESLNYTHGSGWQCKDANGNTKTTPLTAMTSAQLAGIITDETGSGALVFATSPTLVTPALGTPSSGTVTNLTGTASININGTVGATTPAVGSFTTLSASGQITRNGPGGAGAIAFIQLNGTYGGLAASQAAYHLYNGSTVAAGAQSWYAGMNVFATDGSYEVKNGPGTQGFSITPAGAFAVTGAISATGNITSSAGNIGGGTSILHLKAGTAVAGTAPAKFTSGALLTSPEAGAVEFLTDAFYTTITTGTTRRMLVGSQTGRSTAQTAAVASVATYTLGAADASFEVSANVLVTTSSAEAFTVTCAYTDEGNTARTLTLPFIILAGTTVAAINFANGAAPYEGVPVHIRCKASTAITIATTGTFTGATYNVESIIKRTA